MRDFTTRHIQEIARRNGGSGSKTGAIVPVSYTDIEITPTNISTTQTRNDITFKQPYGGAFNFSVSVPSDFTVYTVKICIVRPNPDPTIQTPIEINIFEAVNISVVTMGLYNITTYLQSDEFIRIYLYCTDTTADKIVRYSSDILSESYLTNRFFIYDLYKV